MKYAIVKINWDDYETIRDIVFLKIFHHRSSAENYIKEILSENQSKRDILIEHAYDFLSRWKHKNTKIYSDIFVGYANVHYSQLALQFAYYMGDNDNNCSWRKKMNVFVEDYKNPYDVNEIYALVDYIIIEIPNEAIENTHE